MRVYPILIGLLLAVPWGLFGIVLMGAASSAVGRWLGRRRRPYRVRRRGWHTPWLPRLFKTENAHAPVTVKRRGPGPPSVVATAHQPPNLGHPEGLFRDRIPVRLTGPATTNREATATLH